MTSFSHAHPLLSKALRIMLVFALVFGTTWHCEQVAFGAESTEATADAGGAEGGAGEGTPKTPEDTGKEGGGDTGKDAANPPGNGSGSNAGGQETGGSGSSGGGDSSSAGGSNPSHSESSSSASETPAFTNLIVYELDAKQPDGLGKQVWSAVDAADAAEEKDEKKRKQQTVVPRLGPEDESLQLAVRVTPGTGTGAQKGDDASSYVEWSLADTSLAKIDEKTGKLISTDERGAGGTVTVTCRLKKEYRERISPTFAEEHPGAPFAVTFKVEIAPAEQQEPYIANVTILQEDGEPFPGLERSLELVGDGTRTYAFQAIVVIHDSGGTPVEFTCTPDRGLAELTEGKFGDFKFDDLVWSAELAPAAPAGEGGSDSAAVGEEDEYASGATVPGAMSIDAGGTLTLDGNASGTVRCTAPSGAEGQVPPYDEILVNPSAPADDSPSDDDDGPAPAIDTGTGAHISYVPAPKGQTAIIASYLTGITDITYITRWYESTDKGASWQEVPSEYLQTLRVPTTDEYIGRQYRAEIKILLDPTDPELDNPEYPDPLVTPAVTIAEGKDGLNLLVQYVSEGEDALFSTIIWGKTDDSGNGTYTWYESADGGASWDTLAEGRLSYYSVPTVKERFGHLFKVTWRPSEGGELLESNVQMLAALADEQPGDPLEPGSDGEDAENGEEEDAAPPDSEQEDSPDASHPQSPTPGGKTLSELADEQGRQSVSFDDGTTGTIRPVGGVSVVQDNDQEPEAENLPTDSRPPVLIDSKVNEDIAEARQVQAEKQLAELDSQPGAHWNPVYFANETPDAQKVLDRNPLAALVLPLCLALLACGAVEKYVRYREQKRPSAAVF